VSASSHPGSESVEYRSEVLVKSVGDEELLHVPRVRDDVQYVAVSVSLKPRFFICA